MAEITVLRGKEIVPVIPDIARLRIEVFAEWPYRYDGEMKYEMKYLNKFASSEEAICVVAKEGDAIIGVSTGVPLADEDEKIRNAFTARGYDVGDVFYLSETVLKKEFRGQGIGRLLAEKRMEEVLKNPQFTVLSFANVVRENVPENSYKDLSSSQKKMGFVCDPDLIVWFDWKDIGDEEESAKPLVFWVKDLKGDKSQVV